MPVAKTRVLRDANLRQVLTEDEKKHPFELARERMKQDIESLGDKVIGWGADSNGNHFVLIKTVLGDVEEYFIESK